MPLSRIIYILPFSISAALSAFVFSACKTGIDENLVKHSTSALFDSARIVAAKGGKEVAFKYIDSAYQHLATTSIADKYLLYSFKSGLYDEDNDLQFSLAPEKNGALKYLDSGLQIIEENGETTGLAKEYASALAKKALFCLYDREFDAGGELLLKSRLICQQTGNYCTLAQISDYVGSVLYQQGRCKEALHYYQEGYYNLGRCDGDKFDRFYETQGNLDNTGLCYSRLGMFDSALIYYARDTDFIKKNSFIYAQNNDQNFPEVARAVALANMAQAFADLKSYNLALSKFIESIDLIENYNKRGTNKQSYRSSVLSVADVYLNINKPDQAYYWIQRAENGYSSTSDHMQLDLDQTKSRYYMQKGNVAAENKFLLQTIELRDSMAAKEHDLFSHNLLDVFEHLEKQSQLLILQKDEKIKLFYIEASVGFVLVVLILCGLFYYNWKKSSNSIRRFTILGKKVRQREQQLTQLVNNLRLKTEQKERTLRLLVHDLRSPLSNIKMLTAMQYEDASLTSNNYLNLTKLASTDALRMVDEILIAEADDKEIVPKIAPTDINSFIGDCVALMRVAASEKKQQVLFFPLAQTMIVHCDPEMIRRVVNNIIGNAIKFSAEGKNITVTVIDGGRMATIAIEDQGIGIGHKNTESIFDPFTISRRPGTNGEKSFGLGLSICKKIMEMHGGRLWFTSQLNKGTTFYIELKK